MKEYLGDSVYIDESDFGFVLTTENGDKPSNEIFLEPWVTDALLQYITKIREKTT